MAEQPDFAARETLPGRQRWNPAATGTGRIDGVPKVTGSKLYAADFRAADLPGWPAKTSHALLIRANDATHVYAGLDLSRLTGALKPPVVVTADDLARIGARVPEFYAGDLLCRAGTTPLYLGQPIALLVFEDFDAFDQARLALRGGASVKFGKETGPIVKPPYAAYRFTRVAGANPASPDVYSPVQNGWVSPPNLTDAEQPNWTPLAGPDGQAYAEASILARKELVAGRVLRVPTILGIWEALRQDDDRRIDRDYFLDKLRHEVGDFAEEQLDTAISWGRHAELYGYDDDTDELFLES